MNQYIDIYCERLAPGLLAEPLNAFTNLMFFVAAYFVWRLARRENAVNAPSLILIVLLLMIGTGSSLFHTLALRWAAMTDTLSIVFFQIAFLIFYARRVMNFSYGGVTLMMGLFVCTIIIATQLPESRINVPVSYVPPVIFLIGLGIWQAHKHLRARWSLLAAALLFGVSLTFRMLDMPLCETIPYGLHFIWHTLNAGVLYLSLRSYLCNARK